jgi:hypothetical protein
MRSNKKMEDGVKNLMNVMTRAGVKHQAQMHVMSKLHSGRDKWTFAERDMKSRYFFVVKIIVVVAMMVTIARICSSLVLCAVICNFIIDLHRGLQDMF